MTESYQMPEASPALRDLSKIVEVAEGVDAQEHMTSVYSPQKYPVISGQIDEIRAVRDLAESDRSLCPEETPPSVRIVGRIASLRVHARFAFMDLQDANGDGIQVIIPRKKDAQDSDPADAGYVRVESFLRESRQGDVVLASGGATKSRSSEPSVMSDGGLTRAAAAFLSPDKIGSSTTPEDRQDRIRRFAMRSRMKASIRRTLEESGFVETVTPVVSDVPSGANAEVFTSHIASLDRNAYLRISPELALKTAIVNGYSNRVYEFATNFRNEGIDREHSPEFEMLEFYSAYTSADELRDFTASMISEAVRHSLPSTVVNLEKEDGTNVTVDLAKWGRESYAELVADATGIDLDEKLRLPDGELKRDLLNYVHQCFGEARANSYQPLGAASIIDKLFKLACRPYIQDPTFVERYPAIMVPLARPNDENPAYVDMFQGIIGSTEVIKGYQELNDPVVQLSNLYAQAKAKAEGDTEAMSVDWRYIEVMLRGLPPTAGCGIGIDRLVAILNGTKNIHATMPYPFRERFATSEALESLMRTQSGER